MKKLLLFLIVVMSACSGPRFGEDTVAKVISVDRMSDGNCFYTIDSKNHNGHSYEATFIDDCGKFTVGDTVIIVKK